MTEETETTTTEHDGLPSTKTFTLRFPVKDKAGNEITEITVCEPDAGQLETSARSANPMTQSILLISAVSKLPPDTIRKIKNRDLNDISGFLVSFSGVGGLNALLQQENSENSNTSAG